MKKIIILILFLTPFILDAQILVDTDKVINKYGATADTLNKDDSVSDTYYVKSFAESSELFWKITNVSGASKVTIGFYGSYNHSDWITINETTLNIIVSDTTFTQNFINTHRYPYLKTYCTAVDSVQTTKYKFNLVIDKN